MPLFSAVFPLFRAERKFNYGFVTEHQTNGDGFRLKIQWDEIPLCLVRASSCLYFPLCSVSSEPSVNLIMGLLQTEHQANGDKFQLKIQWAEIQLSCACEFMPLLSAVFRLFRGERKFDYRLVTNRAPSKWRPVQSDRCSHREVRFITRPRQNFISAKTAGR
jgi:hypothetical protein